MSDSDSIDAPAARSVLEDAGEIEVDDVYSVGEDYEPPSDGAQELTERFRRNVIDAGEASLVCNGIDVFATTVEEAVAEMGDDELEVIADEVYTDLCDEGNGQLGADPGPTDVSDVQRYRARIALECLRRVNGDRR